MKTILYTLNHTYMTMGENTHTIYATKEEAKQKFNEYVKQYKEDDDGWYIGEVYEDNEWEFYCETKYGTERIYIEAVEVGLPLGQYVEDFSDFYELLDDIQETGKINMLDAYRVLMDEFKIQKDYAKRIVKSWMEQK